ncbi:MAG: glycosyltransferase family 2 protein [Cyclobacteriaceae bacterium]
MSKTAVVILNYNGAHFLEQFLPILIQHTPNCELIVADNKSTDNSLEVLVQFDQHISIIQLESNFGYAGGYNQALADLTHDYFILLNSDVEVTPSWSEGLVEMLDQDQNVAAVQPKIKDYYNRSKFEYAGAAGGFIDKLGFPYCRGRIFESIEEDKGQYDDATEIFWASGACFIIRASVFKNVGGFDASFFAHMEEIDLCWRINNRGLKIKFQPKSSIFHVGGGTLNKQSSRKTYLNIRNNLFMLYKNLPRKDFYLVFIIRVFLDSMAAIKMGFSSGYAHGIAIFKAWFSFITSKKIRDYKNISNPPLYPFSIVWTYYIKKLKVFNEP